MFSVLHVEHNRFYHEIVRNLISGEELQYIPVKSPREAYKVLQDTKINLIITGLIFEDTSGVEFIRSLNTSRYRGLPILILSSNDDEDIRRKTPDLGPLEFINKNTAMDRLKIHINKYINRCSMYEKLKSFKIAVVNDNEFELSTLKKMLTSNHVAEADYYTDVDALFKSKEEYSLYLLDYALPGVSGDRLTSIIREKNRKALIFVITAVEDDEILSNIYNAGANDYIIKPFGEDVLLSRLRASVTTYLLNRELRNKSLKDNNI